MGLAITRQLPENGVREVRSGRDDADVEKAAGELVGAGLALAVHRLLSHVEHPPLLETTRASHG